MPLRIPAWPHWPAARGTIPSGADPANPQGWQDNLELILAQMNNHTHVIPVDRTWAIPGDITAGMIVVPFFIPSTATTATLKGVLLDLGSGTSATCKLARQPWGGAQADLPAPFNSMVVTTTDSEATGNVTLSPKDKLLLIITAVSGLPMNLTVTLCLEYVSGG